MKYKHFKTAQVPLDMADLTFLADTIASLAKGFEGETVYGERLTVPFDGTLEEFEAAEPRYSRGERLSCPLLGSSGTVVGVRINGVNTDTQAWQYILDIDRGADEHGWTQLRSYETGELVQTHLAMEYAVTTA